MYFVTGFIVPWLMHGFYDYCLSDVMMKMEWPGYAALFLAFFSVILLIIFVRFVIKAKKNEKYMAIITQPIVKAAAQNADAQADQQSAETDKQI